MCHVIRQDTVHILHYLIAVVLQVSLQARVELGHANLSLARHGQYSGRVYLLLSLNNMLLLLRVLLLFFWRSLHSRRHDLVSFGNVRMRFLVERGL